MHGQDLGPGITPLQAGLGWVVGWDKGDFRGRRRSSVNAQAGPARRLRGLVTDGRQPPRHDDAVLGGDTPGGYGDERELLPVLGRGIALALIDTDRRTVGRATRSTLDVRGRRLAARVTTLPFVRAGQPAGGRRRTLMSGYAPHTDAEVASMLGVPRTDVARRSFRRRPRALRLAGGLDLPDG